MPLMMLMMPLKTWWGLMQLLLEMSLKKIAWRRGGLKLMRSFHSEMEIAAETVDSDSCFPVEVEFHV